MGGGAAIVWQARFQQNFKTVLIAPHYDMEAEFMIGRNRQRLT